MAAYLISSIGESKTMKRCEICGSVMSFGSLSSALGSAISSMQTFSVETAALPTAYPRKSPYDSQPDDAYVTLGLLGMSGGREPDLLHACHSLALFRPRVLTYVRACSNVRNFEFLVLLAPWPSAYPRKSPIDSQPVNAYAS